MKLSVMDKGYCANRLQGILMYKIGIENRFSYQLLLRKLFNSFPEQARVFVLQAKNGNG